MFHSERLTGQSVFDYGAALAYLGTRDKYIQGVEAEAGF